MATNSPLPDLAPLPSGRWIGPVWKHAMRTQALQIVGAGAGFLVVAGAILLIPGLRPPTASVAPPEDWLDWHEKLQTLFGVATLLVAGLVWLGELREGWTQQLPRLLSFAYFHEGRPALVCWHAYLPGESDIRALSQQIGGIQMTGGTIQFRPIVDALPVELLTDGRNVYLHHRVRFELTALPQAVPSTPCPDGVPMALVWHPRREMRPPDPTQAVPAADALRELGERAWTNSDGGR